MVANDILLCIHPELPGAKIGRGQIFGIILHRLTNREEMDRYRLDVLSVVIGLIEELQKINRTLRILAIFKYHPRFAVKLGQKRFSAWPYRLAAHYTDITVCNDVCSVFLEIASTATPTED